MSWREQRKEREGGRGGGRGSRRKCLLTQRGIFLTSSVSPPSSSPMPTAYTGDHVLYLPLRRGDVTVHDERVVHGSGKSDIDLAGTTGEATREQSAGQEGGNNCVTIASARFIPHGHTLLY